MMHGKAEFWGTILGAMTGASAEEEYVMPFDPNIRAEIVKGLQKSYGK